MAKVGVRMDVTIKMRTRIIARMILMNEPKSEIIELIKARANGFTYCILWLPSGKTRISHMTINIAVISPIMIPSVVMKVMNLGFGCGELVFNVICLLCT